MAPTGYGDVVFPVQPQDQQVVSEFLGTAPTKDATGQTPPAPGTFTVAVENGSDVINQGSNTASALQQLGYNVTSVTDTTVSASTSETTILYSNTSQLADALRIQSSLSGLVILGYDPGLIASATGVTSGNSPGPGSTATTSNTIDVGSALSSSVTPDIVVVTGSNFAVTPPVSATPSTSVPGASTTTTTGASTAIGSTTTTTVPGPLANSPNLSAPSGATETLEPWDPRSCTATGGPGP